MPARARANIFGWSVGAGLAAAVFALLALGEERRPRRRRVEPRGRRLRRNLAIAAAAAAAVQIADRPFTRRAARLVERRRWGLLPLLRLPAALEGALAFVLLDYTLWMWHVLLHRWEPLWRFHAVHHADRELDTTTAVRFHPGEMIASVPWRIGQVLLIGASPAALARWQSALFLSVLFHHSNLRLPLALERALSTFLVTPSQHGIHHSVVPAETDSNWSSLLNVWDRLHGTLRLDVPPDAITIGLPGGAETPDLPVGRLLALPFEASPGRGF
jgi:sterol desaturase/sphingolipid hydroxylase (fatty acid hydroxylase superfamily)